MMSFYINLVVFQRKECLMKKLSTLQLVLLSTGGMIGCGWLFSPYYGFQTAGVGVLLSWLITALLTVLIAITFAEVATVLPIVGGVMRFMRVTHSKELGFLFVIIGWISYLVFLPLEVQSAIQYLGFWIPSLVHESQSSTVLSHLGLIVAFFLMVFLTWFNTFRLSKVSTTNAVVSIWKIFVPLLIAIFVIIMFASPEHAVYHYHMHKFSFEPILVAVTSSGLAFAFAGFQNGLILANSAANPKRSIPLSVFAPIVIGLILYSVLSLMFILCLPGGKVSLVTSVAPLLGLLSLFGLHYVYVVLFVDAIISPMGTANVYTAITGRILFSFGREFLPKSILTKINKSEAPVYALWINMVLGACFLLPFPTWTELVDFLSSLTLLSCLSGPLALMVLRDKFPHLERKFRVPYYRLFGYLGFASCTFFVYWSGTKNLLHLVWLTIAICVIYWLVFSRNKPWQTFSRTWFLIAYILVLYLISNYHKTEHIIFPYDNYLILLVSVVFTKIFLLNQDGYDSVKSKIEHLREEIINDN